MYRKTPGLGRVGRDPCLSPEVPPSRPRHPRQDQGMQVVFRRSLFPLPPVEGARRAGEGPVLVRMRRLGNVFIIPGLPRLHRGRTRLRLQDCKREHRRRRAARAPGMARVNRFSRAALKPPKPIPGLAARSRDDEQKHKALRVPFVIPESQALAFVMRRHVDTPSSFRGCRGCIAAEPGIGCFVRTGNHRNRSRASLRDPGMTRKGRIRNPARGL